MTIKHHFNAIETELLNGINLLEASAGTGKTYTIAMLVLRFIVERHISIKNLLVVTFTKSATEELKHRIRAKLVEAKALLNGQNEVTDNTVKQWLNQLQLTQPELTTAIIKKRLELALLDIDQAGIFTIHGFCQRVLREHALESGQLFDAELTDDLATIKQACADDFWRSHIYQKDLWQVAVLTAEYKTPDDLLNSIAAIASNAFSADQNIQVLPADDDIDLALKELKHCAANAAALLAETAQKIEACFAANTFKGSYCASFSADYQSLAAWLINANNQLPSEKALNLFSYQSLLAGLNGHKFKNTKKQTAEARKIDYLHSLAITTAPFDNLAAAAKKTSLVFRRALLSSLREQLQNHLQKLNVMSFDDLIIRLASVLKSSAGKLLINELRQRYAAALIDEFQDTDDNQWQIFSRVFKTKSHALYLIGDPKQAIYKFRGADIYSYLDAQKKAQHHFTLSKNWRSQPHLVRAVNTLFARDNAFLLNELSFSPVEPAKSIHDGALYYNQQPIAPLMLWQLADNGDKYWTAAKAAQEIKNAVVNEILQLLQTNYQLKPQNRILLPQDIAILVRSNKQARDYQNALRAAKIPSVINSTESVFASIEAKQLYYLLQSLANPADSQLLKQALSLTWFGFTGQELYQLIHNEQRLQSYISRFVDYYALWQQHGLMAMLQQVFNSEQFYLHFANTQLAERQLTNYQHLIELLQQVALDEQLGIHKTVDYLRYAITQTRQTDEQQLRLESDENAVKIITLHRAKGLEYPVVFCPTLWQRNSQLQTEQLVINCHHATAQGNQLIVDLGSLQFENHRRIALQEELAEDLRLCYVALTRAQVRCYVAWVNVRFKETVNNSALAHLLSESFAQGDFYYQQTRLKSFVTENPHSFTYQLFTAPVAIKAPYAAAINTEPFYYKARKRSLYTPWQMSSYTALSALSQQDIPELTADKADEPLINQTLLIETELPRGAHTGNVVHELLEHNDFLALANGVDICEQRDKLCTRYGVVLTRPEVLNELLTAVVKSPLSGVDNEFCLQNLTPTQCLKEMPFYLTMKTLDTSHINTILQAHPSYQPLNAKTLCGYLTGFIDLICEYKGKYYVMDYKTNALSDYSEPVLIQAMREHNYGLQYWLYTVVLHRYLQQRLPQYNYERDFGGVRYLFVRGMQAHQPMRGVYAAVPELSKVQALMDLFI